MKVKTAELKNHLSHYLRHVQESGESIEVCVRDRPIAVLGPVDTRLETEGAAGEQDGLRRRLETVGLLYQAPVSTRKWGPPEPQPAGDGRVDCRTIEEMRRERDW